MFAAIWVDYDGMPQTAMFGGRDRLTKVWCRYGDSKQLMSWCKKKPLLIIE